MISNLRISQYLHFTKVQVLVTDFNCVCLGCAGLKLVNLHQALYQQSESSSGGVWGSSVTTPATILVPLRRQEQLSVRPL